MEETDGIRAPPQKEELGIMKRKRRCEYQKEKQKIFDFGLGSLFFGAWQYAGICRKRVRYDTRKRNKKSKREGGGFSKSFR